MKGAQGEKGGRSEKRAGPRAAGYGVRDWVVFHDCGVEAAPRCPGRVSPDANSAPRAHGRGGEVAERFPSLGNITGPRRLAGWPSASPPPRETGSRASSEDSQGQRQRELERARPVADILEQAPRMIQRGRQTSWPPVAGKQGLCGRRAGQGPLPRSGPAAASASAS